MKTSTIYKIQSKIRPNKFYIGSAIDIKNRWSKHLSMLRKGAHKNAKLQNHYNKYGEEDLILIIIEPCFPEFLIIREQYYLDTLNPWFNICKKAGSSLGIKRSKEFKEKMRNRIFTLEHRKKLSNWQKGIPKSGNLLKIMELNWIKMKGNSYNLGNHHSEETKKLIGSYRKGKKLTESHKQHMREAWIIRKQKLNHDKNIDYV